MKILFLCLLLLIPTMAKADHFAIVTFVRDDETYAHYAGEITQEGIFELINLMISNDLDHLSLNSLGGDTMAARNLNYFIQENEVSVLIDSFSLCVSSCAFAVMGSKNIVGNDSKLYFHKPFLTYVLPDVTTGQIFDYGAEEAQLMIDFFIMNGYNYQLLREIYLSTDQETYISITVENLKKFKTGFTEKVENPEQYFTIERLSF